WICSRRSLITLTTSDAWLIPQSYVARERLSASGGASAAASAVRHVAAGGLEPGGPLRGALEGRRPLGQRRTRTRQAQRRALGERQRDAALLPARQAPERAPLEARGDEVVNRYQQRGGEAQADEEERDVQGGGCHAPKIPYLLRYPCEGVHTVRERGARWRRPGRAARAVASGHMLML